MYTAMLLRTFRTFRRNSSFTLNTLKTPSDRLFFSIIIFSPLNVVSKSRHAYMGCLWSNCTYTSKYNVFYTIVTV